MNWAFARNFLRLSPCGIPHFPDICCTLQIRFEKYQGTGNDFIVIDNRSGIADGLSSRQITQLCHRKFGIGSDGLMLISAAEQADFIMEFYNPDGSQSLCGNGSRCAVVFARSIGIAGDAGTFVTTDGRHDYRFSEKEGPAVSLLPADRPVSAAGHLFINTGSPHLIVQVADVDAVDVDREGKHLRHLPEFEPMGGTNVNFAAPMGGGTLGVRTFERGVERETLSCGTGVTAAALACAPEGAGPHCTEVHTHGGVLRVRFRKTEQGFDDIWLSGPAEKVFEGVIDA